MRTRRCGDGLWRFGDWRSRVRPWLVIGAVLATVLALSPAAMAQTQSTVKGELDCNGDSPTQAALRPTMNCTDIRGFAGVSNANVWSSRFYDNGTYIGHDEPDMTFLSDRPGSGDNVTWTERIPRDPPALPTALSPGHDVNHWFELSPAPWFSMAMCDPNSYPGNPCTPQSDANAPSPSCLGPNPCSAYTGGGSAFMEMQLYPPGNPPFVDSESCDDAHWCAALTIDSLECRGFGFPTCNTACEEPINFGFIQRNGVPTGPPSPQETDLATFTPNQQTLLMNPGDVITVHMDNAPVPGGAGQRAFRVLITDLTNHETGWMQASAANGFQTTSITDCSGTPYNFQPEYSTAKRGNIVPWAALQTNISTEFETGHWESCTSLAGSPLTFSEYGFTDVTWNGCNGPYEASAPGQDGGTNPETGDAYCYPAGDTHGTLNTQPDLATGCQDNVFQNGDLDFDGNPYWADWPVAPNPTFTFPGSFVQNLPVTDGNQQYQQFFMQTDVALSESTCTTTGAGCAVPPPTAPGHFYPYWSRTGGDGGRGWDGWGRGGAGCVIEFGNVQDGVNTYGGDAQYGTDQQATLGYPEFIGPTMDNSCGGFQPHRRS